MSNVDAFSGTEADIVSGHALAADATILTIPAGRKWVGSISVSGSLTNAASGVAENASVWVEPAGTGVVPAATVQIARISLDVPAATTANSGAVADSLCIPEIMIIASGTTACTLVLRAAGTPDRIAATASGYLF